MRAYDFLKDKYDLSDSLAEELARELEGKDEWKWDFYCIKWLIERFGKQESWDYIHYRCFRIIKGIVKRLLSGDGAVPEDREDLEMEIELELYKCIEKYRGDGSLGCYIWGIGKCVKAKWIRKREKTLIMELEDMGQSEIDEDESGLIEDVEYAITLLPKHFQEVFSLYLEGFSLSEIATQLKYPLGTVRWLYVEGKKKLKKIIS